MHRNKRARALAIALVAATATLAGTAASAAPRAPHTEKVSVAPDGTDGNAASGGQSLSANGRYVAFVSSADNLVAGDTKGKADAFVRDVRTGTTRLASTTRDGGPWDANVLDVSLSADGRYLAFTANATYDLADNHIWIKDLKTGAVQRVDDAVDTGYRAASSPAVSADGRYVAFIALHTDDAGPAGDRSNRVYRLDRVTGKTVRISQVPGENAWKSAAGHPSISADGSRVGYQFFVPYPTRGDWSDAYVRDVPSGDLIQLDKAPDGKVSDGQTEFPQVSADGRYAVFNSLDSRLTPNDTNGTHNVFVRDLRTGELCRLDAADPAAYTAHPSLSADNRYVAFVAVDPNDPNHTTRAYVRDLRTGRTVLANPDTQGGPSDSPASFPVIDRHGRTVAFASGATDLVPGDTYDTTHLYVRHLR
ncbi:component of the Tol biopolymer transport system [Streptomyces sp. cf386]|uniref:TolB family protein n=1 Tax=Streptomyces sp. cf386 TaxID=1761904 RepID=UPI00088C6D1D|nr:PD40 domain-containing protein [Streptomyces sp. cf386]SDP13287.1 component of the Tol biopolymer transport system [Streptomyces sp. cf386]